MSIDGVSVLTIAPMAIGGLGMLGLSAGLIFGSRHPTQMVIGLVLFAVLCGSSVFTSFTWDKLRIEMVAGLTKQTTEVLDSNSQALASITSGVKKLEDRIAAVEARGQWTPPSSGLGSVVLQDKGFWDFKGTAFCTENPTVCADIDFTGQSVTIPSETYKKFTEFNGTSVNDFENATAAVQHNQKLIEEMQRTIPMLTQ